MMFDLGTEHACPSRSFEKKVHAIQSFCGKSQDVLKCPAKGSSIVHYSLQHR
jgi:hypothetical protein